MKQKRNAHLGLLGLGIACIIGACFLQEPYYANMLRGAGIAWVINSILQLRQYWYYAKPEHQAEYEEKQNARRINMMDERKVMLRQMAGHKVYQIMFFVLLLVDLLFALLRVEWWITGILFLLWLGQYLMGIAAFRYYEKRL